LLWQLARRAAHKTKALLTATLRSRTLKRNSFVSTNLKAALTGGFFIVLSNTIVVIRSLRERRADG
jgi:hypothetical protein